MSYEAAIRVTIRQNRDLKPEKKNIEIKEIFTETTI